MSNSKINWSMHNFIISNSCGKCCIDCDKWNDCKDYCLNVTSADCNICAHDSKYKERWNN